MITTSEGFGIGIGTTTKMNLATAGEEIVDSTTNDDMATAVDTSSSSSSSTSLADTPITTGDFHTSSSSSLSPPPHNPHNQQLESTFPLESSTQLLSRKRTIEETEDANDAIPAGSESALAELSKGDDAVAMDGVNVSSDGGLEPKRVKLSEEQLKKLLDTSAVPPSSAPHSAVSLASSNTTTLPIPPPTTGDEWNTTDFSLAFPSSSISTSNGTILRTSTETSSHIQNTEQTSVGPEEPASAANSQLEFHGFSIKPTGEISLGSASLEMAPVKDTKHHTPHTQTALDITQLKFCDKILKNSKRLKDATLFLQPVDPVKLNIPTYFTIIKQPMDISTIQTKLSSNIYKQAKDFQQDLDLMFNNCYLFNGRESIIGQIAQRFQAYFTNQMKNMPQTAELPSAKTKTAQPVEVHRPKRETHAPARDLPAQPVPRKSLTKQASSDLKFALSLVKELRAKHYAISFPFLAPVDPIKQNVPNYFQVIKFPMDFGTIEKKLTTGVYNSGAEFEADSRRVFSNCYLFNHPESEVCNLGRRLEAVFEQRWRMRPILPPNIAHQLPKSKSAPLKPPTPTPVAPLAAYAPPPIPAAPVDVSEDDDSDSDDSSESGEDISQVQHLLTLLQHLKKAKGKKKKKKDKSGSSKSHESKSKKKKSKDSSSKSSSSHSKPKPVPPPAPVAVAPPRPKPVAPPPPVVEIVREVTYEQKRELSEKINILDPDKLTYVYEIIRSGMPHLDSTHAGQEEIELDIDSLDKNTLYKLYEFVHNATKKPAPKRKRPPPKKPEARSIAPPESSSSGSELSGSESDSGESDHLPRGMEEVRVKVLPKPPVIELQQPAKQATTVPSKPTPAVTTLAKPSVGGASLSNPSSSSQPPAVKPQQRPTAVTPTLAPKEIKPILSRQTSGHAAAAAGKPSVLAAAAAPKKKASSALDILDLMKGFEDKIKAEKIAEEKLKEKLKEEARLATLLKAQNPAPARPVVKNYDLMPAKEPTPEMLRQMEEARKRFAGTEACVPVVDLHAQGRIAKELEDLLKQELAADPTLEGQLRAERKAAYESWKGELSSSSNM